MITLKEVEEQIDQVVVEINVLPAISNKFPHVIDNVLEKAGYRALGEKWRKIDDNPILFIVYHIGHDLAYNCEQLVAVDRCEELSTSLIRHADKEAQWYTIHDTTGEEL